MRKLIVNFKKYLLAIVLLAFAFPAMSTHYMGGDLTYQFLGIFGGQYRYEFQLDVYINKLPPSNFPTGNVNGLDLCIYDRATNLPIASQNMTNPFRVDAFPVLPPGCNPVGLANNLDARLNRFTAVFDLPGPFSQYYAVHERCCRDNNINNLANPGSTGNSFFADMPQNFVENSSPQFNDIAIPFLCTGDTTTISNNAFDPDGDFLVYSFTPIRDQFFFQIAPDCDPNVQYDPNGRPVVPFVNSSFTLNEPFGPGSYAFINAANGITKYYAPNPGKYSVAIDIQEYRDINNDGIQDLIGTTTRELFFIVLNCAPNGLPAPSPLTVNGSNVPIINNTADIDIMEGESLSFTFSFNDPNNDSVFIAPEGDIIDGTNGYTGPLATFPDQNNITSVSSTFNWQSACGYVGQFPVRIKVRDNGCPPKDDIYIININVRPFEAADDLEITDPTLSPDTICIDNSSVFYYVNSNNGSTITWGISGGNIIGPNNSDTIEVFWTSPGANELVLIETSTLACSDTSFFEVVVNAPDTIQATGDLSICEGDSIQLTAVGTTNYRWLPNTFIDNPFSSTPTVFPNDTITYVVSNPLPGTCAFVDSVTINVVQNFAFAGTNSFLCTGDTVQLGDAPQSDKVYTWDSEQFIDDSTLANPTYIALNTGGSPFFDTLTLSVIDTVTGCQFVNEVAIVVNPLPIADAGIPDTICSQESTILGGPGLPGTTCSWLGNFINNPGQCQPTVTPENFGSTNLTYQYILNVTNFSTTCSNSDTVSVVVKPLPLAEAGLDTAVCRFQTIDLGSVSQPGYVYTWVTTGTSSPIAPTGSSDPSQTLNDVGTIQNIVTVINTNPANLCTNRDTIEITVNDLPVVDIIPDTTICSGDSIVIGGTPLSGFDYTWDSPTNLSDPEILNPVFSAQNLAIQVYSKQLTVLDSSTGCIDSADLDIQVNPLPIIDAGSDQAICSNDTVGIGTAALAGHVYSWQPTPGISAINIAQPEVTLSTGSFPDSSLYILSVERSGCFDSDSVYVRVNPRPVIDTILGGISICPNLQDVLYTVLDTVGLINFEWGISGGVINSFPNNDSIIVDWGGLNPNASLYMIPTNSFNCVGDTTFLDVDINPILSSPPPSGPESVCLSDATTLIYSVPFTTGYSYVWSSPNINHTQVPINPGNQVAYNFNEPGTALIFVEQQVTTVTNTCLGISDTLEVTIHPQPDINIPIDGDTSICEGTNDVVYTINGFPNSTYQWSVFPGGALQDTINTVDLDWDSAGNYQVVAFETTEFGCSSGDVFLNVQINPIPETEFGSLDTFVCAETLEGNSYSVNGFNNSNYVWEITGGVLQLNDSAATVLVNWNAEENISLSVFEISEFNCEGPSIEFEPQLDLSRPLVANVSLIDPADTFSSVEVFYNKGELNTDLVPDSLNIYRKIATEATWTPIGKISSNDSSFIDDEGLNRLDNYYEYQVGSINTCANEIFSPLHNTIKLEGSGIENLDQLDLTWNEYINWENGVADYEIYRRVDDEDEFTFFNSTSVTDYTDYSANDGFDHFFRVRALEIGTDNESWSNEFLVEFENLPFVTNVLTPNGDGKNDTWAIDNIELYPGTQIQIFNRYSDLVYETDDYKGDWDGENLPSGTYFFTAKFADREEILRGYIELLK